MKTETYEAQGECTNCGRENYPQWGKYEVGKKVSEYPCPKCGCMTWIARGNNRIECSDPDLGKTGETNSSSRVASQ